MVRNSVTNCPRWTVRSKKQSNSDQFGSRGAMLLLSLITAVIDPPGIAGPNLISIRILKEPQNRSSYVDDPPGGPCPRVTIHRSTHPFAGRDHRMGEAWWVSASVISLAVTDVPHWTDQALPRSSDHAILRLPMSKTVLTVRAGAFRFPAGKRF
jgi:hypothetical protein